MIKIMIAALSLICLARCGPDDATKAPDPASSFGELPPGASSFEEMGETDELTVWVVFDPALVQGEVPDGLRLVTLGEIEARDPLVADHLERHPEHRDWARGVFEVMKTDYLRVDGRQASLGPHGGFAIWFAVARPTGSAAPWQLGTQLLNLGSWVSDADFVEYARARGYAWDPAEIDYRVDEQGVVRGRLQAPGLVLQGWCRPAGFPEPAGYEVPQYETFWAPRSRAAMDELVTYHGHRYQACEAAGWVVEGTHPLAGAFRSRAIGGESIDNSEFFSGYFLRGGLYPRQ